MFARTNKKIGESGSTGAKPDDETVVKSNTAAPSTKPTSQELKQRLADAEINLAGLKNQIKDEKTAKRKLYSSLVKLATELKRMKNESQPLMDAAAFAHRGWYEGGMWRAPAILPGVFNQQVRSILREGLSHLFFNLVIVTAFTRVGMAIAQTGGITWDSILYYSVFWAIWTKDLNYTTRFDSTDLSFEFANLLTCIAVLWGSLSTTAPVASSESSRIMVVAGFVALMHLILHLRVAVWFHNAAWNSVEDRAKKHAYFSIATTVFETATWTAGVFLPSQYDSKRWIIFVIGICFSISRLPHNFLDNDFNAASAKRGVLFILLLGFLLQSVLVVASPFFAYQDPSWEQYGFIAGCCIMLYCIKLLYSDDAPKLAQDHALLVNRVSAIFFNVGQFFLLFSTTVLGSGLDLLTHSYLAATAALPHHAKGMVCGGYGAVLFSIFFIKSMHMKRIPMEGAQKYLFVGAFVTQVVVNLAVIFFAVSIYLGKSYFDVLAQDEITLMLVLAGATLFLVVLSWLDEAVELAVYESADESRQALVHPFGLWWCLTPLELEEDEDDEDEDEQERGSAALSAMSPLLTKSVVDMRVYEGYETIP